MNEHGCLVSKIFWGAQNYIQAQLTNQTLLFF